MQKFNSRNRWFSVVALMALTASATVGESLPTPEAEAKQDHTMRIEIKEQRAAALRLEVFDASGVSVYDSGVLLGRSLEVPAGKIVDSLEASGAFTMEVRSWDSAGELLVSQVTRSSHLGEISTINFEVVPTGTTFVSDTISLEGEVDISGGLTVDSAIRTGGLQNAVGSSYFGSCGVGSSIRTISSTGSVVCETDDIGSGGGDNLGNHIATEPLQMGSQKVVFNPEFGLQAPGGAEFKTGPNGSTFQFFSGASTRDIARFNDFQGQLRLAVSPDGGLDFHGGQKICSAFDATGRNSILASVGWTTSTCGTFRDAVTTNGNYQVFCVFNDGFSFGMPNGGAPTRDCGWGN